MKKDLIALVLVSVLSVSTFVPVLIKAQEGADIVYVAQDAEVVEVSAEDAEVKDKDTELSVRAETDKDNMALYSQEMIDSETVNIPAVEAVSDLQPVDSNTRHFSGASDSLSSDSDDVLTPDIIDPTEDVQEGVNNEDPRLVRPIKVTSPNGGELITVGDTVEITWAGGNMGADVIISLFHQNPYDLTTNYGVPTLKKLLEVKNTGSATWKVGEDMELEEGRYFILVEQPRPSGLHLPRAHKPSWDYTDYPFTLVKQGSNYVPVDVNNDQKVDIEDIRIILDSEGACPANPVSDTVPRNYCWEDLDYSKNVDSDDIRMIIDNWDFL